MKDVDLIERELDSGEGATHSADEKTGQCECDECWLYRLGAKAEMHSPLGMPRMVRIDDSWLCGLTAGRAVIVWREQRQPQAKRGQEVKKLPPTISYQVCVLTKREVQRWAGYGLPKEAVLEARKKIDALLASGK